MKRWLAILLVFCFGLAASGYALAEEKKEAMPAAEAPAAEAKPEIKYGMAVGDFVKPVTVASLDGKEKVDISKTKKKTIFLMMSSVCTACRQEMLDIKENLEHFKKREVEVYGVVIDMDPKAAAARIGEVPFTLLGDSEYSIGNATNLLSTPSTLIVQEGKILYTKAGYRPGQWKEYLK